MTSPQHALPAPSVDASHKKLLVRDFLQRDGVTLESPDDRLSPEDTLIEGQFIHEELRPGLFLHVSDASEERAFTASSHLPAGLSCIFFLDGAVDMKMGERAFHFEGNAQAPEGTAIMNARADSFQRSSAGGQRLRHLVVSATPEWLDIDGLQTASEGETPHFLRDHLASHHWTVTPRTLQLLQQIVMPPHFTPALRKLFFESRAVEIVAEALCAMTRAAPQQPSTPALNRLDRLRLARAKDFIAENLAEPLNVPTIARAAGINSGGLQRLFQLCEGASVFDYIRRSRLDTAYHALVSGEVPVSRASLLAGYTRPENFATAFRRQFGMSPREAQKKAHRK
ncbi:helix-turn-helix transcriptional regulator [Ochrobactrum sp. SD129]|jgi:AraC-like DNA-binding protein|nr:helix-turn-helix transcriptional regulator [Ochrobactrum sp. SD129]